MWSGETSTSRSALYAAPERRQRSLSRLRLRRGSTVWTTASFGARYTALRQHRGGAPRRRGAHDHWSSNCSVVFVLFEVRLELTDVRAFQSLRARRATSSRSATTLKGLVSNAAAPLSSAC